MQGGAGGSVAPAFTPCPLPAPSGLPVAPGSWASIPPPCSSGHELSRSDWEVLRLLRPLGWVLCWAQPRESGQPRDFTSPPCFLCHCAVASSSRSPPVTWAVGCAAEVAVSPARSFCRCWFLAACCEAQTPHAAQAVGQVRNLELNVGFAVLVEDRVYSRGGCWFYFVSRLLCESLHLAMSLSSDTFFLPSLTSG